MILSYRRLRNESKDRNINESFSQGIRKKLVHKKVLLKILF